MAAPPKFTLAYFTREGFLFRVIRNDLRGPAPCPLHAHDYSELFWIMDGYGTHVLNGRKMPLERGTLVMMRPEDCHTFRVPRGRELGLLTIMIPPGTTQFLRERYFLKETQFFWAQTPMPFQIQLTAGQMRWLEGWVPVLARATQDLFTLERFLMELLAELRVHVVSEGGMPLWLRDAMEALREPRHFGGGTATLARLAGRTPQHVNRVLKETCGFTATDAVNQARMEYAAHELMMSQKKIVDICLECGFQNTGHFHEVFRQFYGTTPRLYRQLQRTMIQ